VSEWFVFVDSGEHVGPVTTDLLARGIAAGRVPRDARIARGAPSGWLDLMDVPEVVAALDALHNGKSIPEEPSTQPDLTDVMERDEFEFASALAKAKVPSGPPKPPLPPQSKAPLPAAGTAPSPSAIPPPPAAPPPMMATQHMPPPQAPPPPPMAMPVPPMAPPPASLAPSAPPPSIAPKADDNKDAKKEALDPRLRFMIPLGVFGIFVVFSIFVVLYALIAK
jgi:hypothetical protein